jgi:hypothetical protein
VPVEAHFFGDWQPGVFVGFVEAGMLAVRLDGDPVVRECRPSIVRLANRTVVDDAIPDPDNALTAALKEDTDPATDGSIDDPADEHDDSTGGFPWEQVEAGEVVWTDINGESGEGTFVSVEGETVTVQVGEENIPLSLEEVVYGGERQLAS